MNSNDEPTFRPTSCQFATLDQNNQFFFGRLAVATNCAAPNIGNAELAMSSQAANTVFNFQGLKLAIDNAFARQAATIKLGENLHKFKSGTRSSGVQHTSRNLYYMLIGCNLSATSPTTFFALKWLHLPTSSCSQDYWHSSGEL